MFNIGNKIWDYKNELHTSLVEEIGKGSVQLSDSPPDESSNDKWWYEVIGESSDLRDKI